MKVCLIAQGFPPDLLGGTEVNVRSLARSLRDRGHEVVVIAGTDQWQDGFRTSFERVEGLRVHRVHRADPYYAHWHKRTSVAAGDAVSELLERERPDIVHVHHWLRLTTDLVRRAELLGVPTVLTLHDLSGTCLVHHRVRPDGEHEFCERALAPDPCIDCGGRVHLPTPWVARGEEVDRLAHVRAEIDAELGAARAVTALCADQARRLEHFLAPSRPLEVVSPTLRPEELPRARTWPGLPAGDEPLRLGTWGTIDVIKGTDLLVEAVRRAVASGARIELEVAGQDGVPAFADRVRVDAGGLPIRFHGGFTSIEGNPATRVHAFVTATRAHETWGLVADEASALGLPMLLPRAGAFVERFTDRGALFFERADAASLAALLNEVAAHPDRLEMARARLAETPTGPSWAERFEALYGVVAKLPPRSVAPPDPASRRREEAWMAAWNEGFEAAT